MHESSATEPNSNEPVNTRGTIRLSPGVQRRIGWFETLVAAHCDDRGLETRTDGMKVFDSHAGQTRIHDVLEWYWREPLGPRAERRSGKSVIQR